MTKVIVFGSNGAIGSYLKALFESKPGFEVLGINRENGLDLFDNSKLGVFVNEKFYSFAKGAYVLNCAAYNGDGTIGDQQVIDQINVDGTLKLIHQCNEAGAVRFYQLSSYKALGEDSPFDGFNLESSDNPDTAYGKSKSKLDKLALGLNLDIEISVLRLPMVYGIGTGSSILKLSKLVGVPLPVSKYPKKRDYLSLDNLGRYMEYLFSEPKTERLLYLQDKGSLATNSLLQTLAKVNGKTFRRLPVPEFILDLLMKLPVLGNFVKKLNGYSYFREDGRINLKGITSTDSSLSIWLAEVRDKDYERK